MKHIALNPLRRHQKEQKEGQERNRHLMKNHLRNKLIFLILKKLMHLNKQEMFLKENTLNQWNLLM